MTPQRKLGLILAAAGLGARFKSDLPKQFWELEGKPLYLHSLERFLDVVSEAVVVVPSKWESKVLAQVGSLPSRISVQIEAGGPTRQESVFNGLNRLTPNVEYVLVHDAARPCISSGLVEAVVEMTIRKGACIPVLPVRDTVKMVEKGVVIRTIDRKELFLTQTPQGFESGLLRRAFEVAREKGLQGTDESSLVENLGATVSVIEGDTGNLKVTWPEDLTALRGGMKK
jgi:2-C-methyl-D-erythritol 4-phosphate cytidylyltransferase